MLVRTKMHSVRTKIPRLSQAKTLACSKFYLLIIMLNSSIKESKHHLVIHLQPQVYCRWVIGDLWHC